MDFAALAPAAATAAASPVATSSSPSRQPSKPLQRRSSRICTDTSLSRQGASSITWASTRTPTCGIPRFGTWSTWSSAERRAGCRSGAFLLRAQQGGGGREEAQPSAKSTSRLVQLGQSPLKVSRIGIGTLQWGDPRCGFGTDYTEADLQQAFAALTTAGVNLFDTAEVYGYQNIKNGDSSEQILGRFAKKDKDGVVIGTKFFTIPWTNFLVGGGFRLGGQSLVAALKESLKRLGRDSVDFYQIHFPFPTFSNETLMRALVQVKEEGLATAVGVSNYSASQMVEAQSLLRTLGDIPLASNQVRYSLLARDVEKNGLLQASKDRGITLIAYSPLASGLLSSKALARTDAQAVKVRPLLQLLATIGASYGGLTVSQVAIAYIVAKGAIPIPGCKNLAHAQAHIGAMEVDLERSDLHQIEELATSLGF